MVFLKNNICHKNQKKNEFKKKQFKNLKNKNFKFLKNFNAFY